MSPMPRLMITAPSSGCGKSVVASGLMAAYSSRFPVQGFKVGPDYIDPMYHTAAAQRPSRNLDTWMLPLPEVKRIFMRAAEGVSLSIIEGAMGLFDGCGEDPLDGSSAGVAYLLKIPIIMVVDCLKMSASASALVHGFHTFSPSVQCAGVICNQVASRQHGDWLVNSIKNKHNIPVLGCIPCLEQLKLPERHLGLFTVDERMDEVQEFLAHAGQIVQQNIDLDLLYKIALLAPDLPFEPEPVFRPFERVRIAVARDEAFCFYYEDNLDELRRWGAEIVFFSPMRDSQLPSDINSIYFGGGYPELYTGILSANQSMIQDIIKYSLQEIPIYAECGGLMYLTQSFHQSNEHFPMVGLLPGYCEMGDHLYMGYREVQTNQSTLLSEPGMILRGHEFHYSHWENPDMDNAVYRTIPRNKNDRVVKEGYSTKHIQASYIHLHFAQNSLLVKNFLRKSQQWKENLH